MIPRLKFWNILSELPLGFSDFELQEIFDSDLAYDNCGNVNYVKILESEIFVVLEKRRLMKQKLQDSDLNRNSISFESNFTLTSKEEKIEIDNKKVVIEDLIFIDDLEVIIYTTIRPRISTIFMTSLKAPESKKVV